MLIFKEQLPVNTADIVSIKLLYPNIEEAKSHILHMDMQYGTPCIWYQADGNIESPLNEFNIIAIGTGHEIRRSSLITKDNYIGTLLLHDSLVLHYFLVPTTIKKKVQEVC